MLEVKMCALIKKNTFQRKSHLTILEATAKAEVYKKSKTEECILRRMS